MEPDFWHARWEQGLTGWHQTEVNPHLRAFWPTLGLPAGAHVLVPLSGKSLDLLWLARSGYQVTGVELNALAVASFFRENSLDATVTTVGAFQVWRWERLRIFQGDFFDLRAADLAPVEAVFDRASLIAFPTAMRPRYAEQLLRIAPQAHAGLLLTLDYPASDMQGPPFPVSDEEVRALFGARHPLQLAHEFDALTANPRFRERGLSFLTERVYRWRSGD